MYMAYKIGDRAVVKPVKPDKELMKVVNELLAQNRLILESNIQTLKMINQPVKFIANNFKEDDEGA